MIEDDIDGQLEAIVPLGNANVVSDIVTPRTTPPLRLTESKYDLSINGSLDDYDDDGININGEGHSQQKSRKITLHLKL